MMRPMDYTKNGIINWICIQEDDKDMTEIIQMCLKKIDAIHFLKEREQPKQ